MSRAFPAPAPLPVCPRCNNTGWISPDVESNRVDPCGCQGDLRRQQRMLSASIPKRYSHCSLDTFREKATTLKTAKRRVQEFVDLWPRTDEGRGLLMMGGCGVGKTHLAVAALVEIIQSGKPGRLLFSNFQELIQEIQASFDSEAQVSKSEIMRPLLEADLLVLDELGSQKPTTFVQDILYYVINTRYNEERATIFTTNYFDTPADPKEETLTQRIGTRLRSRLYEMASQVDFTGAGDYRRNTL
jgi:DNA replication protein DnaC